MSDQTSWSDKRVAPDEMLKSDRQQLILIIEDDDAIRNLLEVVLDFHGYAVATASSVEEAVSALQQWGDAGLSLVISDINLTQGSLAQEGYALYQRWHKKSPALPYILISADPTNRYLPAIRDGEVRFVGKPFRIEILLAHAQELLGQIPNGTPSTLACVS